MSGENYPIDAGDVIARLSAELGSALQRAVVAEAARDKAVSEIQKLTTSATSEDPVMATD